MAQAATNTTESTGSRLAVKIFNQCDSNSKHIVNGMPFCKLPLRESFSCDVGDFSTIKIRRFSYGEQYNKMSKTIMLMGITGSGKTKMINAMFNYILGVEWDDPFRFILVDEEVQRSSQAKVKAYDIRHKEGFRMPYSLTIVDTAEFGDTEGTERDKKITAAIIQFFENPNGIQVL